MELDKNLIQRVNVADTLRRRAAARSAQAALVDGGRQWTYAQLDCWVDRLAGGLADRGYARGDVLALASGNSAEFLAVYYACGRLGLVCVPLNLGWRPDELAYVLGHSGARGLVVESQLVALLTEALANSPDVAEVFVAPGTGTDWVSQPVDRSWSTLSALESAGGQVEVYVDDRDPLSYLYTSGTTGTPKGVIGTHLGIYLE